MRRRQDPTPPKPSSTPRSTAPASTAPASTAPAATGKRISCGSKPVDRATTPQQPRLFAPDSVWNRPLSPDAPAGDSGWRTRSGPTSSVRSAANRAVDPDRRLQHAALHRRSRAALRARDAGRDAAVRANAATGVPACPAPADARPAAGQDGHLTVWQPSTDSLWEFFKLRRERDGWRAGWGGAIQRVSRSPGYFAKSAWPGRQSYWGATATSLPAIAGTMTDPRAGTRPDRPCPGDLRAQRAAGVYALPARRTDGTLRDPGAIPEGARFRLDPDLDLDRLRMPPARADDGGGGTALRADRARQDAAGHGLLRRGPDAVRRAPPLPSGCSRASSPASCCSRFRGSTSRRMPLTLRRSPGS